MISYHTCPRASAEGKETGGMNVYVLELSKALARMGHHIDIFTRSHEMNDPLVIEESPGVRVIHLVAGPQNQIPKKNLPHYISEFTKNMFLFVKKEKFPYDIVHAHYYMSGLVAEKIFSMEKSASIPRAAFVVNFHTLALMKNLVARDTLERESKFRVAAEFALMKKASAIIASSESDKEYMEYLYDALSEKIHIVYPGIDTKVFHPMDAMKARMHIGAEPQHKIVLFVGRVEPLKGIDTLMYAMKILKKRHPQETVCLWIVGGDTTERASHWPKTLKELNRLRVTLGIPEDRVHFVGRQPETELPYYYNAADLVVMPSHYESFGMTALEAIGSGTPVIVTNVAGITNRMDAKHVSHIASVNNPLLLATQIEHVLADPAHAKQFADEARASIEGFTWDSVAGQMLNVYKGIR